MNCLPVPTDRLTTGSTEPLTTGSTDHWIGWTHGWITVLPTPLHNRNNPNRSALSKKHPKPAANSYDANLCQDSFWDLYGLLRPCTRTIRFDSQKKAAYRPTEAHPE
jgi:hypothetical protein